jgi:hypothetical protein
MKCHGESLKIANYFWHTCYIDATVCAFGLGLRTTVGCATVPPAAVSFHPYPVDAACRARHATFRWRTLPRRAPSAGRSNRAAQSTATRCLHRLRSCILVRAMTASCRRRSSSRPCAGRIPTGGGIGGGGRSRPSGSITSPIATASQLWTTQSQKGTCERHTAVCSYLL